MTSFLLFITSLFSINAFAESSDFALAKTRCSVETAEQSVLYSNEFKNPANHLGATWWWTLPELEVQFEKTYSSGRRLPKRAYYDVSKNAFLLPFDFGEGSRTVEINENFILSIQKHVENALKQKYAEQIFFPDLGHSHLYFPKAHWDSVYKNYSKDRAQLYTDMFADSELKVLYHTAEKLLLHDENKVLLPDPHLQFRYWNRNVVGGNKQSDDLKIYIENSTKYNTVNSIDGFVSYSAGFNISASKDGCFVYRHKGKEYYFDLSLYDLVSDPSLSTSDEYM